MPKLSRVQILVYGGLAVVVLLVGARWIRSGQEASQEFQDSGLEFQADQTPRGPATGDVVVHVAGAVRSPGVYRLPAGSRVIDAVERAGGASADALSGSLNLAARLADGQQVLVPERNGLSATSSATGEGPISLGTATVQQLDQIDGIGPVTAQQIIDFRDSRGGISSVEELDRISGIGPATMSALRDSLQP
ncbi:MAG: helix-hairpin-helix domain-containing protein [bacterium]